MPALASAARLLAVATLACTGTLAGCYYEGGPLYSADRFTYESTTWRPTTVSLVDTRTGQTVWSADVPVGKQLVVNFREGKGSANQATPDMMQWEIMDAGTRFGGLDNAVPVPGAESRRLDVKYRKAPELPEDMTNGGQGAAPASVPNRPSSTIDSYGN